MPKRRNPMHYMFSGKAMNGAVRVITLVCERPGKLTMTVHVGDKPIVLTVKTSDLLYAACHADPTEGKQ